MSQACEFAQIFCIEANAGVEYSYEAATDCYGIMIAGQMPFIKRVEKFAASLAYAGDWAWAVRRFSDCVNPDAFLLRIDCRADEVVAVTLYCRFPKEPTDADFGDFMISARPMEWCGPSPSALAATLGLRGPRGIAL